MAQPVDQWVREDVADPKKAAVESADEGGKDPGPFCGRAPRRKMNASASPSDESSSAPSQSKTLIAAAQTAWAASSGDDES